MCTLTLTLAVATTLLFSSPSHSSPIVARHKRFVPPEANQVLTSELLEVSAATALAERRLLDKLTEYEMLREAVDAVANVIDVDSSEQRDAKNAFYPLSDLEVLDLSDASAADDDLTGEAEVALLNMAKKDTESLLHQPNAALTVHALPKDPHIAFRKFGFETSPAPTTAAPVTSEAASSTAAAPTTAKSESAAGDEDEAALWQLAWSAKGARKALGPFHEV